MSSAGAYADFDEYIEYQIKKTRSGIKLTELITTALAVAVFVVAYLFVFTVLDHWVIPGGFGRTTRAILLGIVVLTSAAWIAWKLVLPWFKNVTGLYAARAIEESDPEIKSAVLNFIDARQSGREIPPHIMKAMEKRAAVRLSKSDVDRAVDRSLLMRLSYVLLGLVVGCCLYTVFSPKQISLARALSVSEAAVATQTEFLEITPGDIEVLAGEFVDVTVDLRGDIPEKVFAYTTTEDRGLVDEPVDLRPVADEEGRFSGRINGANGRGILQPMTYRIVAGDAQTRDYQISVIAAPSAVMNSVELVYPEYMEFPASTVPGGDIDTWEGAEVTFNARTNMPVSTAVIQFADTPDGKGEEVRMEIHGGSTELSGKWIAKPRSDGTYPKHYRLYVKTEAGQEDPNPLLYDIKVRSDQPPEVELLDPVVDLEMPANAVVPLLVQARDKDFKLRSVTLKLKKGGEELPPEELIFDGLTNGYRKQITENFEFHLSPRRLVPGDVISMVIEARDNKPPLGNKATTHPISIRIVAPVAEDEVQEELEKQKKKQQQKLEEREEQQKKEQAENEQGGGSGDADQSAAGGGETEETGEPGGEGGTEGEPGDETGESGEPGDNPDQPRNQESSGGTGEGTERTDKADDAEALNRLIEKMKERQAKEGEQSDEAEQDGTDKQNGDEQSGDKQSGDEQGGDKQSGDKQSGDKQGGDKQSGDEQSGDEQGGDKQGGDKQSGDKQGGDKQGGDKQGGDKQGGDKQGGDKQGGDKQGGDKQGGDKQGGDKQGGDKQGGDKQGGDKQGGDKQSGDKQGGDKQGGDKQSGDKQGGDKQGGDKQGGDKQSGDKQGGDKQGGDKQSGDKQSGDKQGGDKSGGKPSGGSPKQGGKSGKPGQTNQPGGQGGEGSADGLPGEGEGQGQGSDTDPELKEAKDAANLVLKQIEDELQRGDVDEKTLKELGWTKDDLKQFSDRMRDRLKKIEEPTDEASKQKQLEFKEMLKSLNLKPKRSNQTGSKKRDRITDGVNTRRSPPPSDLRELFEAYQRSLSKTGRRK